jgi:CRP-like cAMP-binding protein
MISSYPPAIRRQLLSKHFLISTMPEGALDDLVKFTTVARFEPHRVIFSKGDKGDCLYGILSGRVRIYSNSAEGAEIMLNVLERGELFGEIALLDGSTRTAIAAAMEQADLLRIHRTHFLPYVKANPDLILAMLTLLCQRLRWTSSVIEDAAFLAFPGPAGEAAAGAGRASPQSARARARGYGTLVAARPRQYGRRRPRNDKQTTRPLALCRDRRYQSRRHCDPQLRGAAGVGRLRLIAGC